MQTEAWSMLNTEVTLNDLEDVEYSFRRRQQDIARIRLLREQDLYPEATFWVLASRGYCLCREHYHNAHNDGDDAPVQYNGCQLFHVHITLRTGNNV